MSKAFCDGYFQGAAFAGLLGIIVVVFTNNIIQYWPVLLISLTFIGFYIVWAITDFKKDLEQ